MAEQPERLNRIPAHKFGKQEYVMINFLAQIPEGHTFEDILDPAYWTSAVSQVPPNAPCMIDAIGEGNTFYAKLLIASTGKGYMNVLPIVHTDFTEKADAPAPEKIKAAKADFLVEDKGTKKWCVIRKADQHFVHEGAGTKDEAQKWLDANIGKLTK